MATSPTEAPNGPPTGVAVVVFDIDGTLLDSAEGILAGFERALSAAGVLVPEPAELRSYLGPPLQDFLLASGVSVEGLAVAAEAYHDFYLAEGLLRAAPYPGVQTLLHRLKASGIMLATASAKRTATARAIIEAHGLADCFTLVRGTDERRRTKADTIAGVLTELTADPATTIMVGDRHHDIEGAHACAVRAVGARWGYGVADELVRAGADWLVDDVASLGSLLGV